MNYVMKVLLKDINQEQTNQDNRGGEGQPQEVSTANWKLEDTLNVFKQMYLDDEMGEKELFYFISKEWVHCWENHCLYQGENP
mmetsp:Transcript_8005/g.7504  ORF Transcript_8005/g.7504 Transcript_8005/m.7504 type:complete len:83 (+) Transcript_8005:1874-2122(+)